MPNNAPTSLCIAIAQANFTVGDVGGNTARIIRLARQAAEQHADLVVFPEMAITGYPPEDLVLRRRFQQSAMDAVQAIATATQDLPLALLMGGLYHEGEGLYNAAFLVEEGRLLHIQPKSALPNYGVFDEKRVFTPGPGPREAEWRGIRLGIMICEDMWHEDVTRNRAFRYSDILISINASPYEMGKAARRRVLAKQLAHTLGKPIIYANLVGGQDELVFDGRSFITATDGQTAGRLPAFEEQLALTRWTHSEQGWKCVEAPERPLMSDHETIYRAMMLGLKDYVEKNKFPGVVLGLSGGVDSALTAAVAVDALGPQRVHGVMMPSPYTSQESIEDATALAKKLGIKLDTIPIEPGMTIFEHLLTPLFAGKAKDTTEENIQSRLRGMLLMAISNKFGSMVLTTGNKSEMSVGYATLYGDMCGGYSVLKDVYKTTIFSLSHWRNKTVLKGALGPTGEVVPIRTLTRPPSAELKPNQTDQDNLPPYDKLDAILLRLIEEQKSVQEIVNDGFETVMVEKVARMLQVSEYKRRQAAPGVKITGMSFGRDRRYPITNGFKG